MILGITGGARHGKDTIADFIGLNVTRTIKVSFAEPLKRAAQEVFKGLGDINWEAKDSEYLPIEGKHTVRDLYIAMGKGLREYLDPNIWIKLAMKKILIESRRHTVLITDVRYPNEAEAIRIIGGKILKVIRPTLLPYSEAEVQIEKIVPDKTIMNSSDLVFLERLVISEVLPML